MMRIRIYDNGNICLYGWVYSPRGGRSYIYNGSVAEASGTVERIYKVGLLERIYKVCETAPVHQRRWRYDLPVAIAVRQVHGKRQVPDGQFSINRRYITIRRSRAFQTANADRRCALLFVAAIFSLQGRFCVRARQIVGQRPPVRGGRARGDVQLCVPLNSVYAVATESTAVSSTLDGGQDAWPRGFSAGPKDRVRLRRPIGQERLPEPKHIWAPATARRDGFSGGSRRERLAETRLLTPGLPRKTSPGRLSGGVSSPNSRRRRSPASRRSGTFIPESRVVGEVRWRLGSPRRQPPRHSRSVSESERSWMACWERVAVRRNHRHIEWTEHCDG